MDTAKWQDKIIGFTRSGKPVYMVAGGSGDGDGGAGSDSGGDGGAGGGKGGSGDTDPAGGGGDGGAKEFQPVATQEALDRIVTQRLSRERAKFGDYDDLKKKASQFDELAESQKTELQKAVDAKSAAETKSTEAEVRALRLEVAMDKGLSSVQAKRLVGSTKEELEADADELLASFKTDAGDGDPPTRRPRETLSGGGDPTKETGESDPRKLAAQVPRGY